MLFGKTAISAAELAYMLVDNVQQVTTPNIVGAFAKIAEAVGVEMCPTQGGSGEFLWDICWKGPNNELLLAAESELTDNEDGVIYDFTKLLGAKAPLKVMIYTIADHEGDGKAIRVRIEEDLKRYKFHIENEEYLVVEFLYRRAPDARFYVFCAPRNGEVRDLTLRALPAEFAAGAV